MPSRKLLRVVHLAAAAIAMLTMVVFWSATVVSELSTSHAAITAVKSSILWGMVLLIPAIATAGGTGLLLGGKSRAPVVAAKRRRMPLLALNGIFVLLPSAVFLANRATTGDFGTAFFTVQAVELTAGAINITLMVLSTRDGLRLSGRVRWPSRTASA